jgi:hypothetical protein
MAINKTRSPFEDMGEPQMPARKSGGSGAIKALIAILGILVVLAVVGAVGWGLKTMWLGDSIAKVSSKEWQAIFLTNGQVYFGKVKSVGMKNVTLADIYYLQVVTKPLQTTQVDTTASATSQGQQELTLIKLGNEIHGPTDTMIINRDQILLTEKLKTDSRVVQAISKYIEDQKK